MSSRIEGLAGGEGESTHLLEEYFVRIKFSILESEGTCDGGSEASQYLLINTNSTQKPTEGWKGVSGFAREDVTYWLFDSPT